MSCLQPMSSTIRSILLLPVLLLAGALSSVAHAQGERLVDLQVCRDVEGKSGVDCGAAFPADVGQVHAMLAVEVPQRGSGEVTTLWRFGERLVQRQRLNIAFHRPGGYRTRARQRIGRSRVGQWSVEVLDSGGRSLAKKSFAVGAAAPAEPAPADPEPAEPAPAEPATTEPALVEAEPEPAEPEAVDPAAAEPEAVDPAAAEPEPAEPAPAEPAPAPPAEPIPAEPAPAQPAEPAPAGRPDDGAAAAVTDPASAPDARDGKRRQGGIMLLAGGLLLLVAGVLIARRRAGRAAQSVPEAPPPPVADVDAPATAPPPAAPLGDTDAATDALQRLTDLVTGLWSRWVAATGGSPQRAINRAWRGAADPGRLALDHIRLCNGLETAAQDYAGIPPQVGVHDLLRQRLYAQAPALLGVVCALSVEIDRLDLAGSGLEEAFAPWGGRAGLTAELLRILDDGAAALGTNRLNLVPYETKATTASRDFDAELRPFVLPAGIADRLAAGNRIVRVETPPFADGPRPVVWGVSPG